MLFALLFALNQPLCGVLCSDDAFENYCHLLARAGFGHSRIEEAAFLVQDSAGRLGAIDWNSGERDRVSYDGARPERCIAVMHTHPFGDNEPSLNDRREAQRIHLPIVVVTHGAVTVAWPDGTMSYLNDGPRWAAMRWPARR